MRNEDGHLNANLEQLLYLLILLIFFVVMLRILGVWI